jgi:hypothetical protein
MRNVEAESLRAIGSLNRLSPLNDGHRVFHRSLNHSSFFGAISSACSGLSAGCIDDEMSLEEGVWIHIRSLSNGVGWSRGYSVQKMKKGEQDKVCTHEAVEE